MHNACLIDFHCHLDLYPDFEEVIREAEEAGIKTLAVTTTPRAFPRNLEMTSDTRHVRAALGLHPQLVKDRANELDLFAELLPRTRYVGEVGLDASPTHYGSFGEQQRVFRDILRLCARAGDKVLSVHSVRCATKVLDLVEAELPADRGKVVLHWFSGTAKEAARAVRAGCYFSVNTEVLANPRSSRILKSEVPLDRLLTETDGPFVEFGGAVSRPATVRFAIEGLAEVFHCTVPEMQGRLLQNLQELLRANPKP